MLRYQDLGIGTLINAWDSITVFGGSRMDAEVMQAMTEAAKNFVDLNDLIEKAGEKIAWMTRNEAAYISGGAATGLMLSAAACIAGRDPEKIARLPDTAGMANEIIIQKCQRIAWDRCLSQAGARLVEIGEAEQTLVTDLEQAINANTAAILHYASSWYEQHALPLGPVIETARRRGVPVIVDAAANLPPIENLWRYTEAGADLVIFSGGKGLGGPQATGLILGRKDLVEACRLNGSPHNAIGRVAKVGKEEIMGLLTAVERFLALDHASILQERERWVADLIGQLDSLPEIAADRVYPGPHGQTYPRVRVTFRDKDRRDEMVRKLKAGEPGIIVGTHPSDTRSLFINPLTLVEDEVRIIAERIRAVLAG